MKKFQNFLIDFNASEELKKFSHEMAIDDFVQNCTDIYWLIWLSNQLKIDERLNILAAGLIANQVKHLMKDERSIKAVDAAISFGRGECSFEFLTDAKKQSIIAIISYEHNPYKYDKTLKAIDAAWAAAAGEVYLASSYSSMAVYYSAYWELGLDQAEIVRDYFRACSLQIYKEIFVDAIIKKYNELI